MPPPAASRSAAHAREHLLTVLAPVVESTGHDLEEVTVTRAGRRSLVRVTVDADDGVDLDAVAEVSRLVSEALDADQTGAVPAGSYVLEVSSPGVQRPLTAPRHWRRAIGRLVSVPIGDTTLQARVLATSEVGVEFDADGARTHVPWEQLGRGQVQVEFTRPQGAASGHARPDNEGEEG